MRFFRHIRQISATAYHAPVFINREPECSVLFKIVLFNIKRIFVEPGHTSERILRVKNHMDKFIAILAFKSYYFHVLISKQQ